MRAGRGSCVRHPGPLGCPLPSSRLHRELLAEFGVLHIILNYILL